MGHAAEMLIKYQILSLSKCKDLHAVNSITSGSKHLKINALCKSLCEFTVLINGKDKEDPLATFSLDNTCKFVYIHSIVSLHSQMFIVSSINLAHSYNHIYSYLSRKIIH